MLSLNQTTLRFLILLMAYSLSGNGWAENRFYTIHTNSLTCDFCAYDLEQQFLQMKGVKDFEVDIDGMLFVKTDIKLKFDEPFIKKILLDNGFDYNGMVEKIE